MKRNLFYSIISLAFVNIITIYFALSQNWDVYVVMGVYIWQSIIIGLFQWFKIRDLKQFSTKGVMINNKTVEATLETKRWILAFFPVHFGIFHMGYILFVGAAVILRYEIVIGIPVALFFLNHLLSYFWNKKADRNRCPNIGHMIFLPYVRIIPMHFIMFVASIVEHGKFSLVVFLIVKSIADVLMHYVEHIVYPQNPGTKSTL